MVSLFFRSKLSAKDDGAETRESVQLYCKRGHVAHRGTMILRVKKLLREEMAFTAVIIIGRETHDSRIIITWPGKVARVDVSGINRAGLRRYYRGNDRARETRPLN